MQNNKAVSGGRMIFTGPDGVGDYRPRSGYFLQHIGVGAASPEATGDLGYLWRAAPDVHPAQPRCSFVGEVGWGWHYNQLLNSRTLKTEFRASLEDKVTQKFQEKQ
ncbi:uncharacterized protein C4orf45 homolog [Gouania willdenowi]|uniref:uncharacterized protein C4orf45 homolog n=1 Tax=Gouania willdenowi TaxID=441366 RepID=UPI001055F688|nr:uncharacterized protein C4orf45 homolog [Gouania willdenowi]